MTKYLFPFFALILFSNASIFAQNYGVWTGPPVVNPDWIGIGTDEPEYQLHVNEGVNSSSALILTHATSNTNTTNRGFIVGAWGTEAFVLNKEEGGAMRFYTSDVGQTPSENLLITAKGNVGIGHPSFTSTVGGLLHVNGNDNPNFVVTNTKTKFEVGLADCNGCYSAFAKDGDAVIRMLGSGTKKSMIFGMGGTGGIGRTIRFESPKGIHMTINDSGNVGIGVDDPQNKLEVCGLVRAEEILVEDILGCDFVFEDDYNLRSLEEVEEFIDKNNRLPEIPSAAEVEENGMMLGDFQSKMWMKVEELTLYMIEANKQIKDLQKENEALKVELAKRK